MHKLELILLITFCFIFTNCEKDNTHCDPPPNSFNIEIQDTQGNNIFDNQFNQDAVKLYRDNDTIPISWRNENQLFIGFELIQSNEAYFLELSSLDTDTISIQWHSNGESEICKNYFLDSLAYNNEPVSELGDIVVLIKK